MNKQYNFMLIGIEEDWQTKTVTDASGNKFTGSIVFLQPITHVYCVENCIYLNKWKIEYGDGYASTQRVKAKFDEFIKALRNQDPVFLF